MRFNHRHSSLRRDVGDPMFQRSFSPVFRSPVFRSLGLFFCVAWVAVVFGGSSPAWAQNPATGAKLKIPDREKITLSTKDGVQLSCQYYPGGFAKMGDTITELDGKRVVPIILVHGWGGQGSDYDRFAAGLQSMGYAVIVPDLRGHGQSTISNTPAGAVEILVENMKPRAAAACILDVEAAKAYLLERHNAGELNIELLGIVGAAEGALISMAWAMQDWNKKQLPAFKQGCDVKLMVLLSPPASFGPLRAAAAASHPIVSRLPCLIAVGSRDSVGFRDAHKLLKALERRHQNPEETLRFVEADTELLGTLLLKEDLPVAFEAARFLHTMLFERAGEYPQWKERPNPLGASN